MPAEGNRLAGLIVRRVKWEGSVASGLVTSFACDDVVPGGGINQILPHPGDPELREDYARDANAYVSLAVRGNGPIPRPAGFPWPWGDALPVVEEAAPDVRVINLETIVIRSASVTESSRPLARGLVLTFTSADCLELGEVRPHRA
jgi:poly-gamma-glutamate capsule biosynthesis protein CapA/YwtB (metallophosphatase superfamily)